MEEKQIKRIIEALLFVCDRPLTSAQIKEVIEEAQPQQIKAQVEALNSEYQKLERSFRISEVAGGYQIVTNAEYAPWLKRLYRKSRADKLSRPALETLAIIAYRQPITRQEVENIRGVSVEGVIKTLLERSLVRISGRKQVPGRPFLYSTTRQFMEFFGLQSLNDLPKLEEFGQSSLDFVENQIRQDNGGEDNEKVEQVTQED